MCWAKDKELEQYIYIFERVKHFVAESDIPGHKGSTVRKESRSLLRVAVQLHWKYLPRENVYSYKKHFNPLWY